VNKSILEIYTIFNVNSGVYFPFLASVHDAYRTNHNATTTDVATAVDKPENQNATGFDTSQSPAPNLAPSY